MLRLSIITINYNNLAGLQKTMRSVFDQTFKDLEYIIIDGESNDGSKEFIEGHSDKLSYWVSEIDTGIYNAMNKGIAAASGDYILFVNSGDYLLNDFVCSQMLNDEKDHSKIIYGNVEVQFVDGRKDVFVAPKDLSIPFMLAGSLFHPATFIHASLFKQFGKYDEELKIVSDWSFIFKVIVSRNVGSKYKNINVAMFFKDGLSSLPENQEVIKKERAQVIQNILPTSIKEIIDENHELKKSNNELKNILNSKRKLLKKLLAITLKKPLKND